MVNLLKGLQVLINSVCFYNEIKFSFKLYTMILYLWGKQTLLILEILEIRLPIYTADKPAALQKNPLIPYVNGLTSLVALRE